MRIVGFPNSSASAHWRIEAPFKYLNREGFETVVWRDQITEEIIQWGDVFVLQGIVDKQAIALLHAYQQEQGKRIVVEQDDQIEVAEDNPHKREHEISDAADVIKITMKIADMVTTTNSYLANKLRKYNKKVRVIHNFMDMEVWDLPKKRNTSDRLRIGWAGSITHLSDLASIAPTILRISREFKNLDFVFLGEPRAADLLPGLKAEYMLGVPFEAWPSRLHGLRLDIGLAPLRRTEFNRCKSNIKYLEYGIAQIPSVYSKTVYGVKNFDIRRRGMIARSVEEWYPCLKNMIICKHIREDIVDGAYANVRQVYDLKHNIYQWVDAFNSLTVPKTKVK
jgi:glycosyltransferase involved in cell wall biosynthesis